MSTGTTIFPELSPRAELLEKVRHLQKDHLEGFAFGYPTNVIRLHKTLTFLRLKGTGFYRGPDGQRDVLTLGPEHLSALHNLNLPLVHAVESVGWEKRVLLGTLPEGVDALYALIAGLSGQVLVEKAPGIVSDFGKWPCGTVTGIPSPAQRPKDRPLSGRDRHTGIDTFMSQLNQGHWVYATVSFPLQRDLANQWLELCAREIQDTTERYLPRDILKANRMATHYIKLLEAAMARLKKGLAQGTWQNGIYFFSRNSPLTGVAHLVSLFSGKESHPEPVRGHLCTSPTGAFPFENLLTSQELSLLVQWPRSEYQGFRLREWVDFDQDLTASAPPAVVIGHVMAQEDATDLKAGVSLKDMTRHGLIVGATGTGKTNTLFHLLIQLWKEFRTPFLAIEPTKSEYRNLLTAMPDLLLFTLGNETPGRSAPFRLNPFEFPEGVSLQTHLDFLKAVFNASFVMYAPMPYVLEECLHEIYTDKGWVLLTSKNVRGRGRGSFPTLTDLHDKIPQVVDRIGYDERITMDIKSALKTRINNLRMGGKGLMLDTEQSIPFQEIMTRPAVMELKHMGSDEEKTFVMGLILTALYEHHESGASTPKAASPASGLKHVTLIEEAHRLLRNVPIEKASEEQANVKGKAVETFCNLLAEVRAYGEGILVSEQIPTKLAPDIVKNTNLKVVHRVVSKEEREVMGHSMNMDEAQMRHMATLAQGRAVLFREGLDRPHLIQVPLARVSTSAETDAAEVNRAMFQGFFKGREAWLYRIGLCRTCAYRFTEDCEAARTVIAALRGSGDLAPEGVRRFLQALTDPAVPLAEGPWTEPWVRHCCETHFLHETLIQRGRFYEWQMEEVNRVMEALAREPDLLHRWRVLRKYVMDRSQKSGPRFQECLSRCKTPCLYGYDAAVLLRDPAIHNHFLEVIESPDRDRRLTLNLRVALAKDIAQWIGREVDPATLDGLSLCYAIQKMGRLGVRRDFQGQVLDGWGN